MPAHCIEIYQLRARDGQAFLNVDCKNYSGIGVWGNTYGLCTVLCRKDSYFHLMQFETKAQADEWLETQKGKWDDILFFS